ncbi:MAG: response regulator [Telluria sp.]|jgi:two-component system response regulator
MKDAAAIVLAEDNPNEVELTLHALEQHRLADSVHVARDGSELLDYVFCQGQYRDRCPANLPRLVLLDLKLPKVGGLEVLRRMKGDQQLRVVPVVVLTTSSQERDIVESYRAGANSYITKPVDFDEFTGMVDTLMRYWLLLNKLPNPKR